MAQVIDDLVAATAAASTIFDSAVTFITGVPGMIDTAVQKALANGATAAELAPVAQVSTDITARASAIQTALTTNTPQA